MTIGALRRDAREMSHGMQDLTARIAALEGNAKAAFKRLLAWSIASAVVSSALMLVIFR